MLKFKVTNEELEALAPEVQALYDDSGQLKVDGLEDTSGLKNKLDEVLGETKAERQRRRELEAELEAIKSKKAEEEGDYKALYEKELQRAKQIQDELKELSSNVAKKEIDLAVSSLTGIALDGSGDLLASYVRPRLQYADGGVQVLGPDGQPTASTMDDFKKELMENPALAPILKGSSGHGGGAQGGSNAATRSDDKPLSVEEMMREKGFN